MTSLIHKVAGIIIKDRQLLVVREFGKSVFFSPGGKIEPGESKERVLMRELAEELGIQTTPKDFRPFGHYKAEAAGKVGAMLEMDVLMVTNYEGQIRAGSEIEELAWVDSQNQAGLELGSIFEHHVIPELKSKNLID
ncbi:NUDIX domain-containing protein [Candidatus Saccharibacteria bacterium]|nr:NUDIX domain-containing protein [Candidatus Saccharibacteria bacterium]MCB9821187.1 NUDIX domain-containing protein [Candidatus Nomurabacteria bacterium]